MEDESARNLSSLWKADQTFVTSICLHMGMGLYCYDKVPKPAEESKKALIECARSGL